jgi:putative DNA primase/helicase
MENQTRVVRLGDQEYLDVSDQARELAATSKEPEQPQVQDGRNQRYEPDDTDDRDFQTPDSKIVLRTVTFHELATMNIPDREMLLSPVLPAQGLAMIFAERGIGKTHVAMNIAYAIASGGSFLRWKAPKPRRVLYVDGEMPAAALIERTKMIGQSAEKYLAESDFFRLLPLDIQKLGVNLNLALRKAQEAVEAVIGEAELIVLDNISTLCNGGDENDAASWDVMQLWLLNLRRMGKSVLLIHHAGRGGNPRGTSKREDVLDTVIELKRPDDYETSQGARFEIHLKKARHVFGRDATPFEAKLITGDDGSARWECLEIVDPDLEQVMAVMAEGNNIRETAEILGISKSQVQRLQAKGKAQRQAEQDAAT